MSKEPIFTLKISKHFFQHRDRPGLPVRADPLRDRVRLQDPETTWHVQRVQVHLLHQHRHHHSLVCIRASLSGKEIVSSKQSF